MSMKVKKELILGVSMLIVVVVLWVGSAALSRVRESMLYARFVSCLVSGVD